MTESPRRLWALVNGLPPEAECFRRPQEDEETVAPVRSGRPGKVVSIAEFAARTERVGKEFGGSYAA